MPVIPGLRRLEQEDQRQARLPSKFKVSLSYSEIQAKKKKRKKKMCSRESASKQNSVVPHVVLRKEHVTQNHTLHNV